MSDHKMTVDAACESCKATGLYVGIAERNGSAVVCGHCNGRGKQTLTFQWDDFKGRKRRKDVKRVVQCNPGIGIGEGTKDDGITLKLEDFGGMTYDDWVAGKKFPPGSEMRAFTCPAWWYQTADYKRKPDWDECIGIGSFSQCKHFKAKSKCWERFDREGK